MTVGIGGVVNKKILLLILLLSIGLVGFSAVNSEAARNLGQEILGQCFRVKQVSVTGNRWVEAQQIVGASGLSTEPWIWQVPIGSLEERIKSEPWIKHVQLHWDIFPIRLHVEIQEAEPWLVVEQSPMSWLVAKGGKVIGTVARLERRDMESLVDLPRLRGLKLDEELNSGNSQLVYSLQLISFLEQAGGTGYPVASYELLDQGIRVEPIDPEMGPTIDFLAESADSARKKVQELQRVLSDLRKRGELPREIDLRFKGLTVVR